MTKKEFRQFMLKGRGCCIQAVRRNPERYRSEVLWACRNEIAFEAQCEGSRAWYVYQMIDCFEDKTPFLHTLIAALDHSRSNYGWKVHYLGEMLVHFMLDGCTEAEEALWRKYEQLYAILRSKKRCPRGYFAELNDFSALCVDLGERREAMVKIAEDIGRLYREYSFYDGWRFDWLYAQNGKRILKTLEKKAEKSENIAAYLRESKRVEEEELQNRENRRPSPIAEGKRLKQANREEQLEYMELYLREQEPEERTQALRVFTRCPYPGDISPVVADMESEDPHLRFVARLVLENVQSPQIRQMALDNLDADPDAWFPMVVRNCREEDMAFIMSYVKNTPTDWECNTPWHGLHLDVLKMQDYGMKAPRELLVHIYETSYCPNCRQEALEQMGKRRMLTEEMLEECLYDSLDKVRAYAKRALDRRKNRH